MALGYFLFLQEQIKDIIIIRVCDRDSQQRQYIIQLMGSPLSLPSRSDTRYSECIDIVYIHIQGVLILSSDL